MPSASPKIDVLFEGVQKVQGLRAEQGKKKKKKVLSTGNEENVKLKKK